MNPSGPPLLDPISRRPFTRVARRTTFFFFVVATLWAMISEHLLVHSVKRPELLVKLEVLNSFVFIALAGLLLYALLRVQMVKLAEEAAARRRADLAAQHADTQLRLALKAGEVGAWQWNLETRRLHWSGAHEEIWGMEPGSFHGTEAEFKERVHPDDRAILNACIAKTLATPEPFEYEFRLLWPDGSLHWVAGRGEPVCDENRRLIGLLGAVRDVTRHKQAETVLRESEARFRSYFDLPLHGLAITSVEKGWLEVNERMCELIGYTREELQQMTWESLTHPDDVAADVFQFERVMAGEIERYRLEKRYVRKDGTLLWASLVASCVRKADGSVDYFVAFVEDITERKRAEEEIQAQNEALSRFNKIAVGRELRMIELKREVNELCAKAGETPRYSSLEEHLAPAAET